jgi:hypothetical protein
LRGRNTWNRKDNLDGNPIRLLLKFGHTVVYLVRTKKEVGWYFEIIPAKEAKSASNNVCVYPETTKYTQIASLNRKATGEDKSTYYVVDPGRTNSDCCPDDAFKAKFILVASPDDRQVANNLVNQSFLFGCNIRLFRNNTHIHCAVNTIQLHLGWMIKWYYNLFDAIHDRRVFQTLQIRVDPIETMSFHCR